MTKNVKDCLLEALRRYHSFHAGESPLKVWTGLGCPSEYREVVKLGYMQPVDTETPRIQGWYRLTEAGLGVLLLLVNEEGYTVRDYKLEKKGI
jgi:hypothetical protein